MTTTPPSNPPINPTDSSEQEVSFEEQLLGLADYFKGAALAAGVAVIEGHPEQVLDLVTNLLASWDKIRLHPPVVALKERLKEEEAKRREEDAKGHEEAWAHAERELAFLTKAKEAGFSEEGCFKLIERHFAAHDPEAQPASPFDGVLAAVTQALMAKSGGCGGGGSGGGDVIDNVPVDPAVAPVGSPLVAKPGCTPCQRRAQEAREQLARSMTYMPGVGLDQVGVAPSPSIPLNVRIPGGYEEQQEVVGHLSKLATLAAHYGQPVVPIGGANVLERMGVHTGARLHSVVPTAGLDPQMVNSSPAMAVPPPWNDGYQSAPVDLLGQEPTHYQPTLSERNTFDLLEELWRRRVLVPPAEGSGFVVEHEMGRAFDRLISKDREAGKQIEVKGWRIFDDPWDDRLALVRAANVAPSNNELPCPSCQQALVFLDGRAGDLTVSHKTPICAWFTEDNVTKFVSEALHAQLARDGVTVDEHATH
jgi:hypothetical protein